MFQKALLGSIVFLCGWVLMALEMIGPRILNTVFGSGIYVWGSIISTFLLALSVGYWLGGQLSRRWNSHWAIPFVGWAVSLWILFIVYGHRPINDWLFEHTVIQHNIPERWPALGSAFIFFFLPSGLLGMVSPVAIRLAAEDLKTVGAKAGHLYAISTVGSFLGCLVTTFHLIEKYQTTNILVGHSMVLAVGALLFGLLYSRRAPGS